MQAPSSDPARTGDSPPAPASEQASVNTEESGLPSAYTEFEAHRVLDIPALAWAGLAAILLLAAIWFIWRSR